MTNSSLSAGYPQKESVIHVRKLIATLTLIGAMAAPAAASAHSDGSVPKNLKAQIVRLAGQCTKDLSLYKGMGSCDLSGPKVYTNLLHKHLSSDAWNTLVATDHKIIGLCSQLRPASSDGALVVRRISWDVDLGYDLQCMWGGTSQKPAVSLEISLANAGKPFEGDVCQDTILAGPKQYCAVINGTVNLYDPYGDNGPWALRAAISPKGKIMLKRWKNINSATEQGDYNVYTYSAIALGLFPPAHTDG